MAACVGTAAAEIKEIFMVIAPIEVQKNELK